MSRAKTVKRMCEQFGRGYGDRAECEDESCHAGRQASDECRKILVCVGDRCREVRLCESAGAVQNPGTESVR